MARAITPDEETMNPETALNALAELLSVGWTPPNQKSPITTVGDESLLGTSRERELYSGYSIPVETHRPAQDKISIGESDLQNLYRNDFYEDVQRRESMYGRTPPTRGQLHMRYNPLPPDEPMAQPEPQGGIVGALGGLLGGLFGGEQQQQQPPDLFNVALQQGGSITDVQGGMPPAPIEMLRRIALNSTTGAAQQLPDPTLEQKTMFNIFQNSLTSGSMNDFMTALDLRYNPRQMNYLPEAEKAQRMLEPYGQLYAAIMGNMASGGNMGVNVGQGGVETKPMGTSLEREQMINYRAAEQRKIDEKKLSQNERKLDSAGEQWKQKTGYYEENRRLRALNNAVTLLQSDYATDKKNGLRDSARIPDNETVDFMVNGRRLTYKEALMLQEELSRGEEPQTEQQLPPNQQYLRQ